MHSFKPVKSRVPPPMGGGHPPTAGCTQQGARPRWWILLGSLLLLPACQEAAPPEPATGQVAARASTPPRLVIGQPQLTLADARVVLRGPWGSGPGRFGKRDEASRPGPMSIAVDAAGTVHVLDQVNRRVQRWSRQGTPLDSLPVDSETVEQIALAGAAVWGLVFEPGDQPGYRVNRYGAFGRRLSVRLDRDVQPVTGLFVSGSPQSPDLWVEQDHDTQVQVVRRGVAVSGPRRRVLGRPYRGQPGVRLTARKLDQHRAVVLRVDPKEGTSRLFEVQTAIPLVAIQELDSDAGGAVYLGLYLAREGAAPDHAWYDQRKVVVAWRAGSAAQVVQMAHAQATDVFRPVAVGQDGALYQLQSTEQEVLVRRWAPLFGEVRP